MSSKNKLIIIVSYIMAGIMTIFSPLTVNPGNQGCCAECALKKEDEVEYVHEEEDETDGE